MSSAARQSTLADTLLHRILARRAMVLWLAVLVGAACVPGLARLRTDNSPAVFFLREAPALRSYQRFRAEFGADDTLRVVMAGAGLRTPAGLRFLAAAERSLAALPGVRSVTGPAAIDAGPVGGALQSAPAALTDDRARIERMERLADDPLARGSGIVGREAASILVELEASEAANHVAAADLVDRVRRVLPAVPAGVDVHLVGMPALDAALDASAAEIYSRSFPLLLLLAALLLAATFQGWRSVAIALLFVGFCELVVFGLMGYAGVTLNLVVAVLPPLLFVIALASAVHVLARFRALRALDSGTGARASPAAAVVAARAAYRDKGAALLWTAASTFAGFGSLATSAVRPVHTVGLWAMVAIAVMALAAFTLLPALLVVLDRGGTGRRPFEAMAERFGCALAEFAVGHRAFVYAATAAVTLLAAAGLPRLAVESNALHYLAPGHAVRADFESAERAGIGTAALELVVDAPPGASFATEATLARLSELVERLRAESGAVSVVGVTDLIGAVERRVAGMAPIGIGGIGGMPRVGREGALALLRGDPRGRRAADAFLTPDGARTRITLLVPTAGYLPTDPIVRRARELAAAVLPEAPAEVTGQYPLLLETQKQLVGTLGSSVALTLAAVAAILYLLLRRWRVTLLAMVPNVLPVGLVLGVMAWGGIPLDVTTVMVASTTLGLALDDTIHTLIAYRQTAGGAALSGAAAAGARILGTVEKNAAAYSITGLILGLGFAVCAVSAFAPIRRFGALSALAIALAVIADFLLMPALLGGVSQDLVVARSRGRVGGPGGLGD